MMEENRYIASADCARFEEELATHLEGEARLFVVSHAQACASCSGLLADLEAIRQSARALPQEEPSPRVWANIRAQLEAEGAFGLPACARFDEELPAYLEGEVRPFVLSHSRDCAPCSAVLADIEAIRQSARDLPDDDPSPVVWANVRARLEAEGAFGVPVSGWRQILSWRLVPHAVPLGALAVLIALGSALTLPSPSIQRWNSADRSVGASAAAHLASALPADENSTLVRVVAELENSFRANEASMSPDLKAAYEKSLVSLDGSIRECLNSLRYEPRNALARDYLLTAYTRKAEILSSALEFQGR